MLPWTEQYRPKHLDEFTGNHIREQLRIIQQNCNFNTHFVFAGAGGVGKTSAVNALVKTWYPDAEDRKTMVMEINASDDSGVTTIRERVLPFMKRQCAPKLLSTFKKKILIMDEADQMTPAAQACLRVPLEQCESHTLVFFMGNFINNIIPAILSRCMLLTFPKLEWSQVKVTLERICEIQQIKSPPWALIEEECTGDLRQSIEFLQFIAPFCTDKGSSISSFISSVPDARHLLEQVAKEPNSIEVWVKKAEAQAFSGQAWIKALQKIVMQEEKDDEKLGKKLIALADADYMICSGAHVVPTLCLLLNELVVS